MIKDKLMRQVARWAREAGATSERAGNYGERAGAAFDQLVHLSPIFARDFNRNRPYTMEVSQDSIGLLVAAYNRNLINFKCEHGISREDRIDTHICAGLWFRALVQEPVFACDEATAERWDTAAQEQLDEYYNLLCRFAFYFSFQVLRGHYSKYDELYLLHVLRPIRDYMVKHGEAIAASPAAAVGIFLTVSVFDKDCKEPILS